MRFVCRGHVLVNFLRLKRQSTIVVMHDYVMFTS
jgi:hypothetical protein